MTTARKAIVAASAMVAAIAIAAPASAQIYSLGTGKQGFFTYSAGAAIAKVAADGGLNLRVKPFRRHQRLCAGRQCRRTAIRSRQ